MMTVSDYPRNSIVLMLGKTQWTASRRPIEESAQCVVESTGHELIMDDGVDLETDKLEGMNNLSHASKHEDGGGDPEYDEYMIRPSSEEQHREEEGGGERDNNAPLDTVAQRKFLRPEGSGEREHSIVFLTNHN